MDQVYENTISAGLKPLKRQTRFLGETFSVVELLAQIILAVQELTALGVLAAHDLGVVELGANFSHVVAGHVMFGYEL